MTPIYAIVFKDTKQIFAHKKLYLTIGRAKGGFAHIPEELKSKVEIARFDYAESLEDGEKLKEKQGEAKKKRKQKQNERWAKYQLKAAERNLEEARKKLEQLNPSSPILIK